MRLAMIACVQQLSVRFGHTDALADVSLSFAAGEIHTLVGENGAGKSTLLRVLAGMVIPTGGSVELPRSTRPDAAVEWVPQETALPADLTAAEWIFLGRELRNPLGLLRVAEMERAAGDALAEIDAAIASRRRLRDMSAAQRKQVQLARALRLRPRLLLVDEPTAVLATAEAGHVFAALRRLRDRGAAIVYVSHHLAEVLALADRVTVLRDGQVISTDPVHAVDQAQLVQRMVGRPLRPAGRFHRRGGGEVLRTELGWSALRDALRAPQHERDAEEPQSVRPEEARSAVSKAQVTPRFEARSEPHRRTPLRGFSARAVGWHERYRRGADSLLRCDDVAVAGVAGFSLSLAAGEIVGLAGLVGSGRSEVLEAIAGLRPLHAGRIESDCVPLLLPEDRGRKGLIATFTVRENVFLPAPSLWLDPSAERDATKRWIDELKIRGSEDTQVSALSGGNQQKVLLARILRQAPALLLLDEPTAGIDVGAKEEIHAVIGRLAASGAAVLLASSELPELLELCDRIVAMNRGRIAGILTAADASEEAIAALITGSGAPVPSH